MKNTNVVWHKEKNIGSITSIKKSDKSNKYWWKCDRGHSFKMTPLHRLIRDQGCPYCRGLKVDETNSLRTIQPKIASEWHSTKNGSLTPDDVTPGSNKKVWWQCEHGHEWPAIINNRVGKGSKCPFCWNYGTSYPEILLYLVIKEVYAETLNRHKIDNTEFDISTPELTLAIEYDGRYYHDDEYLDAEISKRDARKDAKAKELGIHLIRVKETYDKIKPHIEGENVVVYNPNGNREDRVNDFLPLLTQLLKPFGLDTELKLPDNFKEKAYSMMNQLKLEINLAVEYPEVAAEWHPTKNGTLTPEMVKSQSNKSVWWKCSICGHEWETAISHRTVDGTGCPEEEGGAGDKFSKYKREPGPDGRTDIEAIYPEVALDYKPKLNGGIPASRVKSNTTSEVYWKCHICGNIWAAQVKVRTYMNEQRCSICDGDENYTKSTTNVFDEL